MNMTWAVPCLIAALASCVAFLAPALWLIALVVAAGSFLTAHFLWNGLVLSVLTLAVTLACQVAALSQPMWSILFALSVALSWFLLCVDGDARARDRVAHEAERLDLGQRVLQLETELAQARALRSRLEGMTQQILTGAVVTGEQVEIVTDAQEEQVEAYAADLEELVSLLIPFAKTQLVKPDERRA
jgi:hypothetical protein